MQLVRWSLELYKATAAGRKWLGLVQQVLSLLDESDEGNRLSLKTTKADPGCGAWKRAAGNSSWLLAE